jgi:hypothetical protein
MRFRRQTGDRCGDGVPERLAESSVPAADRAGMARLRYSKSLGESSKRLSGVGRLGIPRADAERMRSRTSGRGRNRPLSGHDQRCRTRAPGRNLLAVHTDLDPGRRLGLLPRLPLLLQRGDALRTGSDGAVVDGLGGGRAARDSSPAGSSDSSTVFITAVIFLWHASRLQPPPVGLVPGRRAKEDGGLGTPSGRR